MPYGAESFDVSQDGSKKSKVKRARTYREIQYQAQSTGVSWYERLWHTIRHHFRCFYSSLQYQFKTPFSSILTYGVIAIAMTIPAMLYVFAHGAQTLTTQWQNNLQINVFTQTGLTAVQAAKLGQRYRQDPRIAKVKLLTPDQALAEYQQIYKSDNALRALNGKNPFPHVLVLTLKPAQANTQQIQKLVQEIKTSAQVRTILVDKELITRLTYLIDIGNRLVYALLTVFGVGVLLIVGNTIRLEILKRQDEILVTKLIGAKDSYVRRPMLYSGFWFGLAGGVLACLITLGIVLYLQKPVAEFMRLSTNPFQISQLDYRAIGFMIVLSAFLGWLGSWIASSRHLRQIEPK